MLAQCINILHLRIFRVIAETSCFSTANFSQPIKVFHFVAMDFDSLPRRDLQFFCKQNKIPANMTNIAMADALKALEIVSFFCFSFL